jgi:hypothetical protein
VVQLFLGLSPSHKEAGGGGGGPPARPPPATVSWRTGTGRYRNVGAHVRDGVEHVEPSLEDAYLLLRGASPEHETAGEVTS